MLDKMGYGLTVNTAEDGTVTCSMTAMPKELKQDFTLVWGALANWLERL